MVTIYQNTEEKILEAARSVFQKKGFDGARMQEIADEAGINKALLHYYYRSKDNLFEAVFREALMELFKNIFAAIGSEIPLEDKIRHVFHEYIGFVQQKPYIPAFILGELHRSPERITKIMKELPTPPSELFNEIKRSLSADGLKDIDHRQLVVNIIGLSVFPFIAKPMLKNIFGMSEEDFSDFIESRKKELPEFFIKAMYTK